MSINDEIVLGEGVAIDSGAASVVMRAGSGAIDMLIMYAGFWLLMIVLDPLVGTVNEALGFAIVTATLVVWFGIVPAVVETLTRGLSVGRLAVGLRVVRNDGGPISLRYALGRSLVGIFELYATGGMVAAGTSFLADKGRRIGDMLVGTYVMRTRGGRAALPPVAMPPGMAEWAARADIRRLPDGLALTARLFLARAHQMAYDSRYRIGHELAGQVGPYVAPPPPAGTHPETFLAAVLASRRDREYAAGWKAEQRNGAEFARLARLPFGIPDADT